MLSFAKMQSAKHASAPPVTLEVSLDINRKLQQVPKKITTQTQQHIYAYIHTYTNACIHTHKHTHKHKNTKTHSQTQNTKHKTQTIQTIQTIQTKNEHKKKINEKLILQARDLEQLLTFLKSFSHSI